MAKTINTPFAEYREEQVKVNIFDYFVEPSFFDKFCDTKPIIISGARGTGKTTILRALTLSEAPDVDKYLNEKTYLGVYYRVDLNVTTSFRGGEINSEDWEKLFSYYFVCKLSYELINQVSKNRKRLKIKNELEICKKYGLLFAKNQKIQNFSQLADLIYMELFTIRDYVNNCAYEDYPHIGDYATIIKELPKDISLGIGIDNKEDKTVFYLIDEFEGLQDWQQKIILSFLKYHDKYHTFKLCMRPEGIKSADTLGGEYIRQTDDVMTIDLDNLILESRDDYYKYALDVCKRRFDLYYSKCGIENKTDIVFEDLFEEETENQEIERIFKKHTKTAELDIDCFLSEFDIKDKKIKTFFRNNYFEFLVCRLYHYKHPGCSFEKIYDMVCKKDDGYKTFIGNYGHALIYQLCLRLSTPKNFSGFRTLVNVSGGTLRYLLELCNEVFERAVSKNEFDYDDPKPISSKIQTDAVHCVSRKRVNQISAIPTIGLNMRTFVVSLGNIFRIYHLDERLSKWETNHFSIKASDLKYNENVQLFLRDCVMRGVLLKSTNNKIKNANSVSSDQNIYSLHPIYTPNFDISWRAKQKTEFTLDEISILIGNNTEEINKIIKKYQKKYLKNNDMDYENVQMSFDFYEVDE